MPIILRLLSRLAISLALLLAVSIAVFASVEILPGDPATTILGRNASPDRVEALREQLGLESSPVVRYWDWLKSMAQGDLGLQATGNRSVWSTVSTPLRNTAILAVVAFATTSLAAVGGGLIAGRRPGNRADRALSIGTLSIVAMPEFVIAGLLISLFAFRLDWVSSVSLVPLGGTPLDTPSTLILPVATITLVAGSYGLRLVRALVAEASSQPFVEAARLAGVRETTVLRRHLLPSVAAPTAQVLAFSVPYLIGGTVIVEQVFAYPGLGSLLVEQIERRDVTVVEAIAMIMTTTVIAGFLIADLLGVLTTRHTLRSSSRPSAALP